MASDESPLWFVEVGGLAPAEGEGADRPPLDLEGKHMGKIRIGFQVSQVGKMPRPLGPGMNGHRPAGRERFAGRAGVL